MKNNPMSEEVLRELFFCNEDFKDILLFKEVPVFSRSVDLVAYNTHTQSISAIEFKLHDWKRAILQTQSVSLCFDYLYICMPRPKTKKSQENIANACKSNGVGLYFYDMVTDRFELCIQPPRVVDIWNIQKKRVLNYLEEIKDERCN